MARTRKLKSVEELQRLWKEYKAFCDNYSALISRFWHSKAKFVTSEIVKPITYTIKGFCLYAEIPRATFYEAYSKNESYLDTITRARGDCELDARIKFEVGLISPRLAPLWLGVNHCYRRPPKVSVNTIADEWVDAVINTCGSNAP